MLRQRRPAPHAAVLILAALAGATLLVSCAPAAILHARLLAARPAYPPEASAPVRLGDDGVTPLAGGVAAFDTIEHLLATARLSIHLEMYEFTRRDLAADLVAAKNRGVAVTVIDDPSETGTAATVQGLRAGGVDVVDYPVRKMMIDHVKLLVVDATWAVVGGINWGTASVHNHDFDALVTGPATANLERVFRVDLVTAGRSVPIPDPLPDPDVLVAATQPAAAIRPLALDMIEQAGRRLDLELFVLTDVGIVHALERAEHRGVAVHVLLDPGQRSSDASAAELVASVVPVRLYHGHGELLHAKAIVADGTAVLFGSANWSGGGFQRNHELDIELPSSPEVAAPFLAAMHADWVASAV